MSDYGERRTVTRKVVTTFILVQDFKTGSLLGYLRDLTLKGAQVNGKKTPKIDTELTLSFELPCDLPSDAFGALNIPSIVTRCLKVTENPDGYEIGFKFTDLKPKQKERIEKFLSRYQF